MNPLTDQARAAGVGVPASAGAGVQPSPCARRSGSLPPRVRLARRGFTLFELIIAGLLLGAVVVAAVPTVGWIARERRESERRQLALLAAENILERLSAIPWADLTPDRAAGVALPEDLQRQLPAPELRVAVAGETDGSLGKRLSVEICWHERPGKYPAPVRLTAWVYPGVKEPQ